MDSFPGQLSWTTGCVVCGIIIIMFSIRFLSPLAKKLMLKMVVPDMYQFTTIGRARETLACLGEVIITIIRGETVPSHD